MSDENKEEIEIIKFCPILVGYYLVVGFRLVQSSDRKVKIREIEKLNCVNPFICIYLCLVELLVNGIHSLIILEIFVHDLSRV